MRKISSRERLPPTLKVDLETLAEGSRALARGGCSVGEGEVPFLIFTRTAHPRFSLDSSCLRAFSTESN